jgi:hypothetical protein
MIAAGAVTPTVDLLNSTSVFYGKVKFASFARRGSMILGNMTDGRQIVWPMMADLMSFSRSRAIVADGAEVLLAQPPKNHVSATWEPIVGMIIRLASEDARRVEPWIKSECRDLLILMWRHSKQPQAEDSREFMEIMDKILRAVRSRDKEAPPCVFVAEGSCWVHVPTLRNWLSTSALTNHLYPLADIRNGLLLLDFEYVKDVTRGFEGESMSASLWRGPVDALAE